MGYGLEIDMIKIAHDLDLLTSPYVFDVDQAKDMARAGSDILVPHMGLTTSGTIGAKTALTIEAETGIKKQTEDFMALKLNKSCLALRA